MLAIGDKIEIMGRLDDMNTGKFGKIVQIDTRIGPVTQPSVPKRETEPLYSVKLDSGRILNHLREQQLRKI